jgi:outer membrane lipoprotein-sorting protein
MKAFVLIATALILPQEKNEAEELLKKCSEKLAGAKSFQCKAVLVVHGPVGDVTLKQTFLCAPGNKLLLEATGKVRGKDLQYRIVSDGTGLCREGDGERNDSKTPSDLNSQALSMIPRVGLMGAVESIAWIVLGGDKPMECVTFSDFKMGKKEKSGERELQSITYKVTQIKPTRATSSVETPFTLWIDTKTHLPVEREFKVKLGNGDHIFRETFSEVAVDEKIDPAKFELPKEAK